LLRAHCDDEQTVEHTIRVQRRASEAAQTLAATMPANAAPLNDGAANDNNSNDNAVENVSDRVVANDTGDDDDSEPMPIAPPPPPVDDDDDDDDLITQNNDNNDTKHENGADSPINDDADAVVENGSLAVHATLDGSQIVELTDVNDDDDDDDDDDNNNNNNDHNSNNDHAASAEVVGPESPRAPKGVLCMTVIVLLNVTTTDENSQMASKLNRTILRIYGQYLSDDGNAVDYNGIANSPLFESYQIAVGQLKVRNSSTISHHTYFVAYQSLFCCSIDDRCDKV
jgi:hypothetical protein